MGRKLPAMEHLEEIALLLECIAETRVRVYREPKVNMNRREGEGKTSMTLPRQPTMRGMTYHTTQCTVQILLHK
jgi:hypothetical protein